MFVDAKKCGEFVDKFLNLSCHLFEAGKKEKIIELKMRMVQALLVFVLGCSLVLAPTFVHGTDDNPRKPYIVYMGEVPSRPEYSVLDHHHSLLLSAIGDESIARQSKIHSYGKSFNGFAARLLPHEVKKLSDEGSVLSVFPSVRNKLHTTRSWDFVGMTEKVSRKNDAESNIIVGLLDTGIYMESPSFNDTGYSKVPSKWKGECVKGANFTGCNNKVIGAKYYNLESMDLDESLSPVDDQGHGTHTSSTAAGSAVKDANFFRIANGTARGGVPSARIAMYKVCWEEGCTDTDILAAFDDAIADGVDILSVSLGGSPRSFFEDSIAIGTFHAIRRGILTACSAGNDGPAKLTVVNVAPWILTVAASSTDRQFKSKVKLGNGMRTAGVSINTFRPKKEMYPLVDGKRASNVSNSYIGNVSACDYWALSEEKVKGRIVYCLGFNGQDSTIKEMKGAGVIVALDEALDVAVTTLIPATGILAKAGKKIDHYINTTTNPQAVIYKSRTVYASAPGVASFSSRGPQLISPYILKPDLAAPGLNILAAYSELPSVTGDPADTRHSTFNVLSGTSMACPHAAGAAAYVKSFHPYWSPAAIKSALMTTATRMKIQNPDAELASGTGQIHPTKAVDPGLIYDISSDSYISFLCKEGYNSTTIALLTGDKNKYDCSKLKPAEGTDGLNYPTMHTQINNNTISAVFYRTVTYVGQGNAVFKANATSPEILSIKVSPDTLVFGEPGQQLDFEVVVEGELKEKTHVLSALLEWTDSKYSVKSPILIYKQFT